MSPGMFVRDERRRVRSHGRQIEHQAGDGGYLAKATHPPAHWVLSQASERDNMDRSCGLNSATAGKVVCSRGSTFALAFGRARSDERKLC
jgi:hypothetical protein